MVWICDCGKTKINFNDTSKKVFCPVCRSELRQISEQTRITSFFKLSDSIKSMRHSQILKVLERLKEADNKRISVETGLPINCVTGRVSELRNAGEIIQIGTIYDENTNRTVKTWGIK